MLLAGAYFARTADLDFMGEMWPAVTQALRWIDVYGDIDGDGFVETRPRGAGPAQSGWKSSPDAVFHADGRIAQGALALCEVQGYVYGAKLGAARIARSLGEMPQRHRAGRIRTIPAGAIQCGLLVSRHRMLCAGAGW